ncbi:MAG: TraR/DksA family transcriptional regulator [Candidatus Jettenia sp. CY-1]|nr:TraR/DksA family transcriptional regulator [Candidatus Jettenia sp.]WKZ19294.1 MAG: TraR/DksA family transcriptional regulator [Candidatus Jettenia sp. CY-1]
MQKKELKQMENILLTKKNILLREVEERFKKYRDANNGKLTDIAEIASSVLNGDLEMLVAVEDVRELKQIEDALARIRAGHYGVCEQCGQPIKKARLKAIPFATLCVSCKEEEEREYYNEKTAQVKYEWEENIGNSEISELDDIDKRKLGNKIMEFEYDDNKN